MADSLPRALALLASGLGPRGRERLLRALPPDQAARGGDLAASRAPEARLPDPTDPDRALWVAALSLVLMRAPAAQAGALLRSVPLDLQVDVALWLTNASPLTLTRGLPSADAEALEELRAGLQMGRTWELDQVGAVLRHADEAEGLRQILTAAWERDEPAAAALQSRLFGYGDLVRLSDAELQLLMGRVDNATLAVALAGAPEALARRLLGNMSARRAALVRDEAELYSEAEADEVDRARGRLLATARHLYERGQVTAYLGSVTRAASGPGPGDGEDDGGDEEGAEPDEPPSRHSGDATRPPAWGPRLSLGLGAGALAAAALLGALLLGRATQTQNRAAATPAGAAAAAGAAAGTAGRSPRVVVQSGPAASANGSAPAEAGARRLVPGEVFRAAGVDAVLQFPEAAGAPDGAAGSGAATVEVASDTEVQRPPCDDGERSVEEAGDLYLRMGRVRVAVTGESFTVRTPVARVRGDRGALYRVRVALDGTSEVRVEQGTAVLYPARGPTVAVALRAGDGRRVSPGSD